MQPQIYNGDAANWDAAVARSPHGHVLQSYEWGEVRRAQRQRTIRVEVRDNNAVTALAQVQISELPGRIGRYGYVPKGPVVDFADRQAVHAILEALRQITVDEGLLALKIEPEAESHQVARTMLAEEGFHPARALQPRHTIWIDLERDAGRILDGMKHKTRYNTRLAVRRGVEIASGTGSDDLIEWYDLLCRTSRRDGFAIRPLSYYAQVLRQLQPAGLATLLLARHEGELLAGNILLCLGPKAVYMYGASSDHKRSLMPTYLLQWQGMEWSRRRGFRIYDLWGVSDRAGDSLAGVSRFKCGFGGRPVEYAGAFDYVRARIRHRAIDQIAEPLLKLVGRVRLRENLTMRRRLGH